ncbi:hypothetical protein Lupro_02305 [Lutibacter profundi]|uniref:Glycosyltransferase 2-like domain-containing protein n=1 Tax=Lutibacter profundi TaxID=1622118 RepID=A0A120IE05_9FLAO|nr:galactosyltransferase-related protein [Lutibacter profundi]AMC10151.1 hypothetical protein Lupro_02305 [Lutibacter profundi]
MITIALTYRNRDIRIVKKCLDSLHTQTSEEFKVILLDYGSDDKFAKPLKKLIKAYSFIQLIYCSTQGQLWNKSRAINITLKHSDTPYLLVGDIDMIYRNDFVEFLNKKKKFDKIIYFQVGFLSREESLLSKQFHNYNIKHVSNFEATGITLYPTNLLKSINGYDEFYHGWGAEDTDVHIRLKNAGYKVQFYDTEVLLLHQWHPKVYRSSKSKEPYHSYLEKINHQYLQMVISTKKVMANTTFNWGEFPIEGKLSIQNALEFSITNQKSEIDAFLYGLLNTIKNKNIYLKIEPHKECMSLKNNIKKVFNKKTIACYDFKELNDLILVSIIAQYRNCKYVYEWDKEINIIKLIIAL